MNIRKLQKAVVDALEDIKAHHIDVFDVTHLSPLFDRIIIASADSTRQVRALAEHVEDKARALGGRVIGIEGIDGGEWALIDLGDLVVHVMQPSVRAHYNLEELWNLPKPRKPGAAATGVEGAGGAGKTSPKKPATKKAPAGKAAAKRPAKRPAAESSAKPAKKPALRPTAKKAPAKKAAAKKDAA
ncbi:MAG: ribosome silencing factor [Betaproteobacteria bacterium]|nr:ribosome silencing factor [Betaproteobacteria bacterium]